MDRQTSSAAWIDNSVEITRHDGAQRRVKWAAQNDELRVRWKRGDLPESIADALGRSPMAVMVQAARLGLKRRYPRGRKPNHDTRTPREQHDSFDASLVQDYRVAAGGLIRELREVHEQSAIAVEAQVRTRALRGKLGRIEAGDPTLPYSIYRDAIREVSRVLGPCEPRGSKLLNRLECLLPYLRPPLRNFVVE